MVSPLFWLQPGKGTCRYFENSLRLVLIQVSWLRYVSWASYHAYWEDELEFPDVVGWSQCAHVVMPGRQPRDGGITTAVHCRPQPATTSKTRIAIKYWYIMSCSTSPPPPKWSFVLPSQQTGSTALMLAARGGHLEIIKKLTAFGAILDTTDEVWR